MMACSRSPTRSPPHTTEMVVLVDESGRRRSPSFQRAFQVRSSPRPAGGGALVSELAVERAERLVEVGHDVVVLLDGVARLVRTYNLAAPASAICRGVDSAALYPPKKILAAREDVRGGGSLTILATALTRRAPKMERGLSSRSSRAPANMELILERSSRTGGSSRRGRGSIGRAARGAADEPRRSWTSSGSYARAGRPPGCWRCSSTGCARLQQRRVPDGDHQDDPA